MNSLEKALQLLLENSGKLGVSLNPPATEEDLKNLKSSIGQDIPKDIIDFYSYCNGFETVDFMFRIIPISEILEYKGELTEASFYFAEYMIYSDVWTLNTEDSGNYTITNDNHGTQEKIILSCSIFEFIERYARGGVFGLLHWYEETNLNKNPNNA